MHVFRWSKRFSEECEDIENDARSELSWTAWNPETVRRIHEMVFRELKAKSHVPCRAAKRLDCVFPIWFTQCSRVWFTHAMLCPCHGTTMPFWKRLLKAMAQRGMTELASAIQRRHVGDLPTFGSSSYHVEFHEGCYQKHTNPLNCRTSSSDISGYHADFHEGHGTVGEWQGHGMACVN
jgi:hypothetical protein